MDKAVIREPKKQYSTPLLKVYGTVQALTQRVGAAGNLDGGTRNSFRTAH